MSRIVFNPLTSQFDQVRSANIDVDSAGVITDAVTAVITAEQQDGGLIANFVDLQCDSAIDSALAVGNSIFTHVDAKTDSALDATRDKFDGGYEFTGGFSDRVSGAAGVSDIGNDVEYTPAMVSASSWLRFGIDSDRQQANDTPYWTNGAGGASEAPGSGTTAYRSVGLFSGSYMPYGVTSLFNFTDDSVSSTYNQADTSGTLQYNAASGSYNMSELLTGDFCQFRFDFNATPQFANTTVEVGLIWQTRTAGGVPTFTFALTGEPIFYGSGTTGKTFLNRPIITAYIASLEDVNARALPAIRSDQPIFIQPLTTLFTVGR